MSSAGHIADMISRIKNNRLHHDEKRNRQKKIMDSFNKPIHAHEMFHNIDLSDTDQKELISNIRQDLKVKNRNALKIQIIAILVIGMFVGYLFFNFFF